LKSLLFQQYIYIHHGFHAGHQLSKLSAVIGIELEEEFLWEIWKDFPNSQRDW